MNSTPENNDDKLDRLLDRSLNSLPEREAPKTLLPNIMALVAQEQESVRLSWFVQLKWPVVAISACFVFLTTYFSNDIFRMVLGLLSSDQFAGEIQGVNSGISILSTLGNALVKVVDMVPAPALYSVAAALFFFSAFSCAGVGTVLFRLTKGSDSITSHNAI
ncbi:MAG: hypothetical protein O3C43_22710 [Verrucomicrobia bacterium]|nr:hypothetical protein [Verrucomicrobiota bacterium]MDA1069303.1 hypothetical protein [Verrucomicrobiota bacterium]